MGPKRRLSDIESTSTSSSSYLEGIDLCKIPPLRRSSKKTQFQYTSLILWIQHVQIIPKNFQIWKDTFVIYWILSMFYHSGDYVFVKRHIISFPEGFQWVYCCTCNPARSEQISSLSQSYQSFKGLLALYGSCIHIDAMIRILQDDNVISKTSIEKDHSYQAFSDNEVFTKIPFDKNKYIFKSIKEEYAVMSARDGRLFCHTCSFHRHCQHVKDINILMNSEQDLPEALFELMESLLVSSSFDEVKPQPISKQKIDFDIPILLQERYSSLVNTYCRTENGVLLFPEKMDQVCECGSQFNVQSIPSGPPRYLFCKTNMFLVQMHTFLCTRQDCDSRIEFDGAEHFLINMGSYLVHHALLRDYMFHLLHSGTSMFNYFKVWRQMQIDHGNTVFDQQMSYRKFRWAWHTYINLLDLPPDKGFLCPICKNELSEVVMDGTSLGYHQRYTRGQDSSISECSLPTDCGSRHIDRILIKNKQLRNLLGKYSRECLSQEEFSLLKSIAREDADFMFPFLVYLENEGCAAIPPAIYKSFIIEIIKPSAVCGILHPSPELDELQNHLEHTPSEEVLFHPELMRLLSMQCPVFCKLVASIGCFPLYLLSIFQKMVQVAKAPFQTAPPKSGQTLNEDSSDLSFFPLLPLIRDRGNYKADGERKLEESTQFCRKPTVRHPALIPGIFTLFCVHGVCYGYSVMESAESVNIPFTIMRRRLMEGPQIVFYDNSCKLHSYCLNRDPLFFKSTWFLIDRLHWKNHTACNIGYNADMYPQLHGKNTQVAEQYNARIKKMKHHLPYMTKEHFMKHMELYLWYHSRNIIRKMHCSGV